MKGKNRNSYRMTLLNSPQLENKQHLQHETTRGYLLLFGEHFEINTKSFKASVFFLNNFLNFKPWNHGLTQNVKLSMCEALSYVTGCT